MPFFSLFKHLTSSKLAYGKVVNIGCQSPNNGSHSIVFAVPFVFRIFCWKYKEYRSWNVVISGRGVGTYIHQCFKSYCLFSKYIDCLCYWYPL